MMRKRLYVKAQELNTFIVETMLTIGTVLHYSIQYHIKLIPHCKAWPRITGLFDSGMWSSFYVVFLNNKHENHRALICFIDM